MPYSVRQLRCFEAVGIIPWVPRESRGDGTHDPLGSSQESSGATPGAPSALPASSAPLAPPAPDDSAALAAWLRRQPATDLQVSDVRGASSAADLLVAVLPPSAEQQELPLTSSHQELLDAMLRAIDLSIDRVRLVAVGTGDHSEPLEQLLDGVNVVLFLYCSPGFVASAATACMSIGRQETPGWSCPHPAQLLDEPLAKRGAWESLKAVRRVLDEAHTSH